MAAVSAARFRPHFLAIEEDDMVDAFKSGAAVVVFYSGTAEKRGLLGNPYAAS